MKQHTVLVVDDQPINRKLLARILADEYDVLQAENGQEALEILREKSEIIAAVLLDIVMPVMNGYQVLEAMAADPVLSKIPVIVSSQKDGDEDEVRALSLGAQDFIAKPYKADIIHHRLRNTIKLRETAAIINRVERDELTGLYNKQFFLEKASEQLFQNPEQKYDLLCLGIERFKLINETYGTARGDALLRCIADQLRKVPRPRLAARFMADMFYLLVPHRDVYTPEIFGPYLQAIKDFPIDMDVKLHCGIYAVRDITIPVSVMCDRAQLAAQKNKGMYDVPFCWYDDSLRQKLMDEQFITSSMRSALEGHQFQVFYQPKYDLNNEMVAGAEALVRWIHPERGMISPGAFIPLFETNGFITQLDEYVWETACRDIRSWIDAGYHAIAVSVNVSRADIYNPKLADILLGLVAKYGIPIHYLHLEITESAYTNNPDQIISVVNRLRELGFLIEMDDFGSGYSSLNMLAEMPVDVLKLDMGFIQHETANPSGRGILSFVISLAKWLNLAVVAEGVETAAQIATLRSMDCNYVQGFYFARPMKKADFDALLRTAHTTEMICHSQTEQKPEEPPEQDVAGRVMLVVDDIELNRAVLASAFEGEYTVVEKENGSTAWEYLQRHCGDVDIVMLDLLMPVMDGFQLLNRIRSDDKMRELPVIITSQGDSDSEQRALNMQADDFISKPYNPEIIRHRVRNVLESHRLRQLRKERRAPLPVEEKALPETILSQEEAALSTEGRALLLVERLKPYFDIVRLVDPEITAVRDESYRRECSVHACFSVWGKNARCNNCISLKALRTKGRYSKLEYNGGGLHFVVSAYVPYGKTGAVIEMVTKLEDEYVDNVLDRNLLYANLDAINRQLDVDPLTGVYNRRYIDAHLEDYVASAKCRERDLGVAMVDIDDFKRLNDTYGHQVGDTAIKAVARMLSDNIALSKGDFVARYGGDEFLIVCRDIPQEVFARRIAAVGKLIRHFVAEDGRSIPMGISVGCASLSEEQEPTADSMVNLADRRLYRAKQTCRGGVVASD